MSQIKVESKPQNDTIKNVDFMINISFQKNTPGYIKERVLHNLTMAVFDIMIKYELPLETEQSTIRDNLFLIHKHQ